MNAIETQGLTREFGRLVAVKDLSLTVRQGAVYGFLGPNGAGKSTTIHMLMGFIRPTAGTARIMGYDIASQHDEIMRITGYLPERPAFYDDMSGAANLAYFGKLIGVDGLEGRIGEVLRTVGLEGRGDDRAGTYSHGMRQRLGIAVALLGRPKLLVLDEPTTGLDPQGSHDIREIVKKLKGESVTIFLSSHILHEVQDICDVVGIVKKGSLIVEQPMEAFLRSTGGNRAVIEVSAPAFEEIHLDAVRRLPGVGGVTRNGGSIDVVLDRPDRAEDVNIALVGAGCRVRGIREKMPSLEDAFLKATADGAVEG